MGSAILDRNRAAMGSTARYVLFAAAMSLLTGCAPTMIKGDENGAVIENRSSTGVGIVGVEMGYLSERSRELALEKADRHCMQFGKRARLVAKGHNAYQFACYGEDIAPASKEKG